MAEASPSDVQDVLDTDLANDDIHAIIQRTEREWKREYASGDFDDTQHIEDFEAALTALRIAEGRDRRAEDVSSGRSSVTYETSEVDNLRKLVRRIDPGDTFGYPGGVVRDTDRYVTSTDM